VGFVTFDCADPRPLAGFWAATLGYEIDAAREDRGEVLVVDPEEVGPSLALMQVPESKVVKNRVHLDLQPEGRMEDEVKRLVALGATAVETLEDPDHGVPDPSVWTVMLDPEGNEFCVIEEKSRRS
jgi:hypothetical protein